MPLKRVESLYVRLFLATAESVFLYGSETWTLTKSKEKQIDVTFSYNILEYFAQH